MPLSCLGYDPDDLAAAMERLRRTAAGEGIEFAPRSPESLLANTHRALAASAIVQEQGPSRFEALHHANPAVLGAIAAGAGLNAARLDAALASGAGEAALREAAQEAHRRKITAVPAYVFDGREIVIGAYPAEALCQAAERAAASG
jgi:predicted DsbA family dithiol-disulfide isomerase